jgi:hypothetical protein
MDVVIEARAVPDGHEQLLPVGPITTRVLSNGATVLEPGLHVINDYCVLAHTTGIHKCLMGYK